MPVRYWGSIALCRGPEPKAFYNECSLHVIDLSMSTCAKAKPDLVPRAGLEPARPL